MAEFNEMNNDVVSGVEPAKKGKGKLVAGITAGAIAVVAGGGAVAYASSDYVKNQVKLTVSSPENYYAWVSEKNTEDFAKQVGEQYRTSLEEMKSGQKSSVSLKYEANDDARNFFTDGIEDATVLDIIKNISSISIGMNADSKDSIVSGNAFIALNDDNLVTFDMAVDSSAMDVFFCIPELNEQWIDVEADDVYGISNNTANSVSEKMKNLESVITPDELESEINKYGSLWNECIADVSLEKKADIAIADINVNYTVASVTLDEAKANEIAVKFVNAVKEDEILKSIVVDRLEITDVDGYNADLDDLLEEIESDTDLSSEDTVTINTYIDPTGCIRGVSFETSENDSAKFIVGKDGDEIRGEFTVSENGEEEFNAVLTVTDNGGKYSGSLDMTFEGETASVEFTDLETVDEKKGYMNGVVTVILPESTEIQPISLELSSDGNSQQIALPLDIEGTNYGKFTLTVSSENGAEPSVPDKSTAFVINDDTDAELSDYVEQAKVEEFVKNIILKIGFSEEDADEVAKAVGEELYYDYSAYYDYDDFDTAYSYDGWDDDEDYGDFGDDELINDEFNLDEYFNFQDEFQDYDDPYKDDIVIAGDRQAYLGVCDNGVSGYNGGYEGSTIGYNATVADITGNGTYTVKVTADTDGYRNLFGDKKPNGISQLFVEFSGMENQSESSMEIKSIKIDGKEIAVTENVDSYYDGEYLSAGIYSSWAEVFDETNMVDLSDIGEWTEIEVTFEVKGMK
ncbi:MAG: hypothetical protein NC340_01785 [Ruminococcus flavefaciens]|nr:hypothetical protein [Ruminococcus flavefaciens]MCM1228878.1 hypothetical protein [Ruminococcus flavefaciens]